MDFPELPEDVKTINRLLKEHYGQDSISGQAMWRISWSNDQYEKRMTNFTPEGFELLTPQVFELPKYQWVKDRWILERLCLIPDVHVGELPTQRQSYECMYPFQNAYTGDALPPKYEAAQFVIDAVYAAMGKKSMRKYVDEEENHPVEVKEQRINKLVEELFGDESSLLGRTVTGEAVAYTGEPKIITSQE
jgi:hypothetical protein